MKRFALIILLAAAICYIGTYLMLSGAPVSVVYHPETPGKMYYRSKENLILSFVTSRLMGENGEISSISGYPEKRGDIFSESVGLMMSYCLLRQRKDLFDLEYNFLKTGLLTESRHVKWKTGNEVSCNALIDDLRIVRALLKAYDKWENREYFNAAGFIQEGIFKRQTDDGMLAEFYDWSIGEKNTRIPLCYLDLYTMYNLEYFNPEWLKIAAGSLSTIKNGRISGHSPLFYKYYDYNTGKYRLDEEYEKTGGVCIIYSLYTAIHLAEVNEDTRHFTEWLKKEMEKGRLYAWYNPHTLKPAGKMENAAVYALAAVYSKLTGELELYFSFLDKMLSFMVSDDKSLYFGGLGDAQAGVFHAFDSLTALWALALTD